MYFCSITKLYKYKVLSLIIAIKRKNSNSKLLYKAKYKLAKDFNLAPQTFCKLLKSAIEYGWVTEDDNGYQAKKFHKIILDFNYISGYSFWNHNILKSKDYNFKTILNQVEQLLVVDNVINPQLTIINRKTDLSKNKRFPTVRCAEKDGKIAIGSVRTSARHTSNKLGISSSKANKILNKSLFYTRKQHIMRFYQSKKEDVEKYQKKFPRATVWFSQKQNKVIAHHGSTISLNLPYG